MESQWLRSMSRSWAIISNTICICMYTLPAENSPPNQLTLPATKESECLFHMNIARSSLPENRSQKERANKTTKLGATGKSGILELYKLQPPRTPYTHRALRRQMICTGLIYQESSLYQKGVLCFLSKVNLQPRRLEHVGLVHPHLLPPY